MEFHVGGALCQADHHHRLAQQLEQTIAQNNSGLTLTFTVEGTQASQSHKMQQSQPCSNADLIADATAQAQKLAAAAGLTLGPILRLSNAPSSAQIYCRPPASFSLDIRPSFLCSSSARIGYLLAGCSISIAVLAYTMLGMANEN